MSSRHVSSSIGLLNVQITPYYLISQKIISETKLGDCNMMYRGKVGDMIKHGV